MKKLMMRLMFGKDWGLVRRQVDGGLESIDKRYASAREMSRGTPEYYEQSHRS